MPRVVWKGAIAFGLVHVPVVLHGGARRANLDFDWIDKRDMAPVGYSRINKRTGKPIDFENIVKGYEYEKGEYVLMSDEDFRQANPKATQTVEIISFVDVSELAPYYFNTPYYLAPDKRGEKGYALLRETLRKTHRAGIANVVLHTKQHLAAVIVLDDVLLLNTMRYPDEILSYQDLDLPGRNLGKLGISTRESEMALRLVEDMTEPWEPEHYRNTYRDDLLARIEAKIEGGQTHTLTETDDEEPARPSGNVIDLMAMLKQSIESRTSGRKRSNTAGRSAASAEEDGEDAPAVDPPTSTAKRAKGKQGEQDSSAKKATSSRKGTTAKKTASASKTVKRTSKAGEKSAARNSTSKSAKKSARKASSGQRHAA